LNNPSESSADPDETKKFNCEPNIDFNKHPLVESEDDETTTIPNVESLVFQRLRKQILERIQLKYNTYDSFSNYALADPQAFFNALRAQGIKTYNTLDTEKVKNICQQFDIPLEICPQTKNEILALPDQIALKEHSFYSRSPVSPRNTTQIITADGDTLAAIINHHIKTMEFLYFSETV